MKLGYVSAVALTVALALVPASAQQVGSGINVPVASASSSGGSGTVTSANIIAGTNVTETGTCNSTTAISCTLNVATIPAADVTGLGAAALLGVGAGLQSSGGNIILGDGVGISYTSPGQLTLASGTITSNAQALSITQTWNASGTTFDAAALVNVTPTAFHSGSYILDIQAGNSTNRAFAVDATASTNQGGGVIISSNGIGPTVKFTTNGALQSGNTDYLDVLSGTGIGVAVALGLAIASADTPVTFLTTTGAGITHLGKADANAAPVAQTLGVQSVATGASNINGANWTHVGSLSTGTGTSGDISFQTGGTGAGAAVQNSAITALTIKGATQIVQLNAITSDATHTDATVCEDTTTHGLYAGSGSGGICLGTSSARYKHDISDLSAGLDEVMLLRPKRYFLNADHGDPNKPLYGFVAEDGAAVVPELIGHDASGRPNTFDYLGIVPILVRAIQEQQSEIEALRR